MPALQAMPDKLQVMGANRLGHFQYKKKIKQHVILPGTTKYVDENRGEPWPRTCYHAVLAVLTPLTHH